MSRTFATDVSRGFPARRPIDDRSRNASAVVWSLPLGETLVRCALAVIFLWFGAMKFTDYEAAGTARWIMDSPLVGWWHTLLGIKGTSIMLGIYELTVGVLLLMRPFSSRLAAVGAGMGVIVFLVTLSFFLSTPGIFEELGGGFPAISHKGAFLLKDIASLGACLFLLGRGLHVTAIARLGKIIMYAGLAAVFLVVGLAKFYDYEAAAIAPLIMNSPLVGWWHAAFGIKETSVMLGVIEMTTGVLFAARLWSPLLSAVGAAMASVALLITLSFFFTTPGVAEPLAGGFPALSAELGQFLLKDLVLLAIAIYCLLDSLAKMPAGQPLVPKANTTKPIFRDSPAR